MLISKRRLQWSAIALLVLCAAMLFRPTRQLIDQLAVSNLVDPRITVGELIGHTSHSVLEVRNLEWSDSDQAGAMAIRARIGWFVLGKNALAHGQLGLQKFVAHDVCVHLNSGSKPLPVHIDPWKLHVAKRVADLDWDNIRKNLPSILAIRELNESWSSRIERWVVRSKQIVLQAELIDRETSVMDNPLRFEESIREKIARLEVLREEQSLLTEQFANIHNTLATESTRINGQQAADLANIAQLIGGDQSEIKLDEQRKALCIELQQEIAQALWNRFQAFAEAGQQLRAIQLSRQSPDYDRNIRAPHAGTSRVPSNVDFKLSGMFASGDQESPFTASGRWSTGQGLKHASKSSLAILAKFETNQASVEVKTRFDLQSTAPTHIQLTARHLGSSDQAFDAHLTADDSHLNGTLSITSAALEWIESESLAQLLGSEKQTEHLCTPLQFQLAGTWEQPQTLASVEAPNWLAKCVHDQQHRQIESQLQQARHVLQDDFQQELSKLQELIHLAAQQGRSELGSHSQQLLATQTRLQQHLDKMTGTEFARRPSSTIR